MPIDASAVGRAQADLTVTVERGRLRFFAKAIGETDPTYIDVDAARSAGHNDLPVPPTFFFSLDLERPNPFAYLTDLGVDLRRVLHGEQGFTYHAMAHAGDELTLRSSITDLYTRKGGALEFVVRETEVTRSGEPVATLRNVAVVQNPAGAT